MSEPIEIIIKPTLGCYSHREDEFLCTITPRVEDYGRRRGEMLFDLKVEALEGDELFPPMTGLREMPTMSLLDAVVSAYYRGFYAGTAEGREQEKRGLVKTLGLGDVLARLENLEKDVDPG